MIRLAACLIAATVASLALAQENARAYDVPGRGKVQFLVPDAWFDAPRPRPGGLPSVRFFDKLGPRPPFDLSITIAWSTSKPPSYGSPERLRAFVAQSRDDVAAAAAAPRPELREIEGAGGLGYYFQATIESPPAGEWPHLTRGAIVVGDLLVAFTILAAEPDAPQVGRALKMLASGRRVP
ncbi:MAG: hypothetical protein ACREVP_09870 [Burkholderiales bacterium]